MNCTARLSCSIAATVLLAGCGKDDIVQPKPPPADSNKSEYVSDFDYNRSRQRPARPRGLRDNIVGKWIDRFPGGQTLTFSADGSFQRYHVTTKYQGTYKILDEKTMEIKSASVFSQMRYATDKLTVSLDDDILQIAELSSMGFRRDKTAEPNYYKPKAGGNTGRQGLEKQIIGTWRMSSLGESPVSMTFQYGTVTFTDSSGTSTGRYRVLSANTIEVNRTASVYGKQTWTVKIEGDRLDVEGHRSSYSRQK